MKNHIIILGPVGSGKSTQAKLLSDFLDVPTVSAGDVAYYASLGETPEAKIIKETMQRGDLLPDDIMYNLMTEHLGSGESSKEMIIDGFPRTLPEAEMFTWPVGRVIYIYVLDGEATKRLFARGCMDHKPDVIANRLNIYQKETEPVLEYYRSKEILLKINGDCSPEQVFEQIKGSFEENEN